MRRAVFAEAGMDNEHDYYCPLCGHLGIVVAHYPVGGHTVTRHYDEGDVALDVAIATVFCGACIQTRMVAQLWDIKDGEDD
jgi:transcription elongation factor Elf1